MRKPDLFDEIIQCLCDTGSMTPSVSVAPDVLGDLFSRVMPPQTSAVRPATAARQVPASQTVRTPPPAPSSVVSFDDGGCSAEGDPSSMNWEQLAETVRNCRLCPLHAGRTNTVFGDGNRKAELMFIGEGPGADEDARGLPFVGRAGELLTRIITAMQFERKDVYIGNVVKCRPPGNRTPLEEEAMICKPYLLRQIELISPKVIVLLGATPARYILGSEELRITRLRGHWQDYRGIKVMPTFHPAYLLRNPPAKAEVWQDMQQVMKVFGKTHPVKQR